MGNRNNDMTLNMDNEEEWKEVMGSNGDYLVSSQGKVKSMKFGRPYMLNPSKNHKGYSQVSLSINKKSVVIAVHKLVADTFLVKPEWYMSGGRISVNHKDGNRDNNDVSNLEFCTQQYNCHHARKVIFGNAVRPRVHGKISDETRREVRRLYSLGIGYGRIGRELGITKHAVRCVLKARSKMAGDDSDEQRVPVDANKKMTLDDVTRAFKMNSEGLSVITISRSLGVTVGRLLSLDLI